MDLRPTNVHALHRTSGMQVSRSVSISLCRATNGTARQISMVSRNFNITKQRINCFDSQRAFVWSELWSL